MILKGKKVILRPIEFEDLEIIRSIINNPDIEKSIIGWALPISRKDQEKWYSNYSNSEQTIRYVIQLFSGEVVGLTGIGNIDMKNGCATTLGIRIIPDKTCKGLATDTYMTLFNFVFNELRLHRIETSAFNDNIASLKFQEKLGCKKEGIKRDAVYKDGKYKDVVILGCLKEDFMPFYKNYNSDIPTKI